MIVALAGRRIDAPDTTASRFPPERIDAVRERIRTALTEAGATVLVAAAACGADLIALEAARTLGLRRHVVLPVGVAEFRAGSVVDRGRDRRWGEQFDRVVAELEPADFVVAHVVAGGDTYRHGNVAILDRAQASARASGEALLAVAVWDGPYVRRTDYTEDFVLKARARGIAVRSLGILSDLGQ